MFQQSLDWPRFCLDKDGTVCIEDSLSQKTISELKNLGHKIKILSGHDRSKFGRGQIIYKDCKNGILWGGSDGRADGCASGIYDMEDSHSSKTNLVRLK